jgi:hypothetical protein
MLKHLFWPGLCEWNQGPVVNRDLLSPLEQRARRALTWSSAYHSSADDELHKFDDKEPTRRTINQRIYGV